MLTETQINTLHDQFEAGATLFDALNAAGLHHIRPRCDGVTLWREWKKERDAPFWAEVMRHMPEPIF